MPRALGLALVFSLILHAFIFWILRRRSPKPVQEKIEVQFLNRHAQKPGTLHARTPRRGSLRNRSGGLSRFVPKGPAEGRGWKNDFFSGRNDTGIPEQEWGSGGGDIRQLEHLNQYQRLFDEVEGLLYYPGRLGYHGYGGTVNVRLAFDGKSHCDWERSRIYGAHPYLRFFVLSMMKRLCGFETVEHLRFRQGQHADLSFRFALTQFAEYEKEQTSRDHITGNVLSFYRSFVYSDLEYRLGPLHGYWFVPVVNVDFEWLSENWEKYVQGHDPLREFKDPD